MSGIDAEGTRSRDQTVELTDSVEASLSGDLDATGHFLAIAYCQDSARTGSIIQIADNPFVIGRGLQTNEKGLQINDRGLSKRHATLLIKGDDLWLQDLNSRNKTYVDGAAVAPETNVLLVEGSVLRLGSNVFVVRTRAPRTLKESAKLLERLPGRSAKAVAVRDRLARLVLVKGPVLLLGQTGTGKEYAALAIHEAGASAQGEFVDINCGALSRNLAQAHLFGSEVGAFTDAKQREGLIARANGGTLFLDEVGELDLDVQKELLRFLQDGSYRRVGGEQTFYSSARIVAATNVDLKAAVEAKTFRQDLYARLTSGSQPIELAPLTDRREDLPAWFALFVEQILAELAATANSTTLPRTWSAGVIEAVLLHNWPENLRELKAVAREAVLAATAAMGKEGIESSHLPRHVAESREHARDVAPQALAVQQTPVPREVTPEELKAALITHKGVVRRVAEVLGINRRELYRLGERFNISFDDYRPPAKK